MPAEPLTYASYLRLDDLLAAQHPRTPADDPPTWAAERFFIVCHQVSELWASQVRRDLALAVAAVEAGEWSTARMALDRAAGMVELLVASLLRLYHLPREAFLRFRTLLEGASGAESEQLLELLRGPAHHHVRALDRRLTPARAAHRSHGPECGRESCRAARALDAVVAGIRRWQVRHVEVAQHFIAGRSGTGGTSGVAYLRRRLATGPLAGAWPPAEDRPPAHDRLPVEDRPLAARARPGLTPGGEAGG